MNHQHFCPLVINNSSTPKTTLDPTPHPLKRKLQELHQQWKKQCNKWRAVRSSNVKASPPPQNHSPPQRCLLLDKLRTAYQHLHQEFEAILELWINLCDSQLSR